MIEHYILEDKKAVPVSFEEWSAWFGKGNRRVARDKIGNTEVSTVFLGLDHAFGGPVPLLFETMVFGGPLDGEENRYSTWDEAVAGHETMVEKVKAR